MSPGTKASLRTTKASNAKALKNSLSFPEMSISEKGDAINPKCQKLLKSSSRPNAERGDSITTRADTSWRCFAAYALTIWTPKSCPTRQTCLRPSDLTSSYTSSATSSSEKLSTTEDRPTPLVSGAITVKVLASSGMTMRQVSEDSGYPCTKTSVGPAPAFR